MATTRRSGKSSNHQAAGGENLVISFNDNLLIRDLLGEYDVNLAMIEDQFGIHVVAHGNVFTLTGPRDAIGAAKQVLEGLYDRLADGETISHGDVDGAIRHAAPALGKSASTRKIRDRKSRGKPSDDQGKGPRTATGGLAQIATRKRLITARSPGQSNYLRLLAAEEMLFATGPAGTGKTYLAVANAAALLERGEVERLILSRPAVEAGERLGFLPGDMKEKVDPYFRPLYDALYDVLPPERVERGMESGAIEIAPLAFMRGRTFNHAMVILDEAQNCSVMQMKMFLTRLGESGRMVVTGDPSQTDLPRGEKSGLVHALGLLKGVKGIAQVALTAKDVVRHDLVARIIMAYDRQNEH